MALSQLEAECHVSMSHALRTRPRSDPGSGSRSRGPQFFIVSNVKEIRIYYIRRVVKTSIAYRPKFSR